MQNGHGKMDERGKKFSSAFTCKTPTLYHLHTSPLSSFKLRRYHHNQGEETTTTTTSSDTSNNYHYKQASKSKPLSLKMSPLSSSSTEEYHIHQAEDITGYTEEENNTSSSLGPFSPTIISCPTRTPTTNSTTIPKNYTTSNNAATIITTTSTTSTFQVNLPHSTRTQGLHHRSRIKGCFPNPLPNFEESPSAKQTGEERRGRRKRGSSTHSSSTPPNSTLCSPSSSRFLLTFLSSCHLVQVTSRLVVALAMTSLFLLLVHVMPGAYCSSSTMSMYSSSSSSSASSYSVATGGGTRRAYFNQSVHPLKAHKPSSSSSSSGGGTGDLRNPAFWLNTKWPTMGASRTPNNEEASVVVVVDDEVENANNKLYSNQLAVATNPDYDNQNKIRNNNNNGENISAKNDLITAMFKSNKDNGKIGNSPAIASSNSKTRNNNNEDDFNGNNNRSNYFYDSFVESTASASSNSQNQSSFSSIANNHSNNHAKRNYSLNNKNNNDIINKIENTQLDKQQQQPENRGTTIYYELESDKNLMGDFDLENEEMRGEQRASTAKIGGGNTASHGNKGGSNNGTTKAERDTVVNVSSTGVRPTMAFTNSYYGRQQFRNEEGKGGKAYGQVVDLEEEESYGNHEDDNDEMMQGDQSHPFEDNNQGKGGAVNEEDDFGKEGKIWSREKSHINNRYGSIISNQNEHSDKVLEQLQLYHSHHHLSSGPTAKTTTTTTKLFKTPASTTSGGGSSHSSSSLAVSSLFYSAPSPSSSSSSSSFSPASKVKSIKSSEHLLSPISASSSTVTIHYPNEKGSSISSSSSHSIIPKASSATLSNQNPSHPHHHPNHNNNISSKDSETHQNHHHHHYHLNNRLQHQQQQPQPHQQLAVGFGANQVLNFGDDYGADDEQDEIVDEQGGGDDENDDNDDVVEDIDAALDAQDADNHQHQHQNHHDKSNAEKVENDLVGKSTQSSAPAAPSQSTSHLKQERGATRQTNKSVTKVLPTRYDDDTSNFGSSSISHIRKNERGVLVGDKDGALMHLPPTAAAVQTFPSKKHDDDADNEEDILQADDPSISGARFNHDNLVAPEYGTSSNSNSNTNTNPNKNASSNFSRSKVASSSSSAPASTSSNLGNGIGVKNSKQRNPLQIRRDLSRLIANAAGRNGQNGPGSSVVGADDEPLPNKCDRLFMSSDTRAPNGTFESPTMISEEGHLYQCIFMFVARPMERVEVVFTQFNVRGTPPECAHEWVDIWTETEGTDPTDLVTTPFSGRYCGKIPPRRRISLYGGIAIGFYSDKNSTDETIFRGTYGFIADSPYQIGTPVPRTLCSYTILGASKRRGDLISPTYPGVYPKNLSCSYKFIGIEGQRIRLEFRDFDVFYGGAHCPFDEVKVFDGMDPSAPLIGTYCGQQRNLVVFSSAHLMLVTFTTLDRSTEAQNRGFKGVWEFSESFVKLDFIEKNMGTHIRGTECDQRILSKGQSSGVVYSPNYPFPYVPKIVCRYFVYGLQDPQHLERVRLSFEKFDVITNINSEEDTTNQSEAKKCGDGFLKVYLKGQEVIQAYDKADYEFCGKDVPHDVVSDGPRLVLVFSSGEAVGSGFKARYNFETEYRVPGTAAPDGSCHFTYYSTSRLKGEFNSPRFPSNYPSMTNCTYMFFQQPNEQIRIVFDNFKMKSERFNLTDRGAYGDYCEEDWVEIYNVISDAEDRLVGRYCGSTAPGPIESLEKAQALKVILHTDTEGVSSGFKARYLYFTAKSIFGECGENITQAQSGVLTSPKWPQKYDGPQKGEGSATCNWYLSVRPGSRVMLHFQNFAIEGEPNVRGCPAAAVRIWVDPDGVPMELCGEVLTEDNSQYVSTRNIMRVTFITADKAVGAPGFRAVWTEVQEVPQSTGGCHHSYFRCEKSKFCIPSELKCDGTLNCGTIEGVGDKSDEDQCNGGLVGDFNTVIAIVVGVAISLFFIVLVCAWAQRRKRRRRRRLQLRRPPIHVCDNAGARFAAMDSV